MKITLTPSQTVALKWAPNDWQALPDHLSISVLRLHGLVVIRDAPGDRTINRGFQWKITLAGFHRDGRKHEPKAEPELAAIKARAPVINKRPVDRKANAGPSAANQASVALPDAVLIGVSVPVDRKSLTRDCASYSSAGKCQ